MGGGTLSYDQRNMVNLHGLLTMFTRETNVAEYCLLGGESLLQERGRYNSCTSALSGDQGKLPY